MTEPCEHYLCDPPLPSRWAATIVGSGGGLVYLGSYCGDHVADAISEYDEGPVTLTPAAQEPR